MTKEDKLLLETIKECSFDVLTKEKHSDGIPFLQHIFRLYPMIFGEVCTGCPSKIAGYILKLKSLNIEKMQEKIKSKFKLSTGVVIPIFGTSKAYTNENITDEIAIELLKQNPNRRSLFSTVPNNLEELLSEEKPFIERKQSDILPLIPALELINAETYLVQENAKSKPREKVIEALNSRISELNPAGLNNSIDEVNAFFEDNSDENQDDSHQENFQVEETNEEAQD